MIDFKMLKTVRLENGKYIHTLFISECTVLLACTVHRHKYLIDEKEPLDWY